MQHSTPALANRAQANLSTLQPILLWPAWLSAAALIVLALSPVELPLWLEYLPFIVSIIFLGLPHGAIDHLVLPRLHNEPIQWQPMLRFLTGYLALVGVYIVGWFFAPVFAFIFFILMTWFHWGQGELYTLLDLFKASYLRTQGQRILTILVKGGLTMLVPFLAFPETYQQTASSMISIFWPETTGGLAAWFAPSVRWSTGLIFASLILLSAVWNYTQVRHRRERTAYYLDIAETGLLTLYFSLVSPILAIGMYFCLWHSVRHIIRLALIDAPSALALRRGNWPRALTRFARDAAPLTLIAIVMLVGFYFFVPLPPDDLNGLFALYLALIAALTLPHVVVVCWMDWQQGIWQT